MASINLDTAGRLNIICRRGDTFTLQANFGEAVPTTGWTFRIKSRSQVAADIRLERKVDESEIVVSDDSITIAENSSGVADALMTITISSAEMAAILPGTYSYDLQNETSSGVVKTYLFGSFKVNSDV